MKQSLQLRLGQHLTMTPQLQQAIRLLQLSTLELQTEIQQVLDSNPMLELSEDEGEAEPGFEGDTSLEPESLRGVDRDGAEAEMNLQEASIPEELPVDTAWDDIYDYPTTPGQPSEDGSSRELPTGDGPNEDLREHLLWQMRLTPFSETDLAIATTIIDSINDDGYLNATMEDIRASVGEDEVELDEVEAVLHRVQQFDPPGVGARNLAESLIIQLCELDPGVPWRAEARRLVAEHLDVLAQRDYGLLMRRLKLGEDELRKVIALVQSLNPRPGSQVASSATQYVVPDVIVNKHNGRWQVELNPDIAPRLRINPYYASLVRRADSSADNSYLKNSLQEARWFLKSLRSRSQTLLKVASTIVERQRAFLDYGDEAMKPLVLHDIAEALDMHESTISRVTTQKYMHTPRGIFELKYFFSSHVGTASGGACSSTAIRALIRKLIAAEHAAKPLSDSKIADILREQGIQVARRTVAKYREAMAIPPSNERKRLV